MILRNIITCIFLIANIISLSAQAFNVCNCSSNSNSVSLDTTLMPLYEWRDIWAEEGGAIANNSSQYSFGNGATGFIGLPIDDGWEVVAMYYHSDNNGVNDDLTINLVDMRTQSVAAPIISTITINNSGDGVGNNGYLYQEFTAPIGIPDGAVLGFRTGTETGVFSDVRVGARLRRKVGDFVSEVTISN